MGTLTFDHVFTPLDLAAFAFFVGATLLFRVGSRISAWTGRSLVGAIQKQRVAWMMNMAKRGEQRNMDVLLLGSLVQGNAFFASTSAIALGGAAAIIGSGEKAQAVLDRLPYVQAANPILWEVKLFLIMSLFVYAFFKFAWAFRLGHYTAIMIGATPLIDKTDSQSVFLCQSHAARTARLAGLSAEHSNSGLRAFYYAISVMAWFFHPLAFIAATAWVVLILVRRDFFSRSLRLIAEPEEPAADASKALPKAGEAA
jgi:uncharacterized membrane protein